MGKRSSQGYCQVRRVAILYAAHVTGVSWPVSCLSRLLGLRIHLSAPMPGCTGLPPLEEPFGQHFIYHNVIDGALLFKSLTSLPFIRIS